MRSVSRASRAPERERGREREREREEGEREREGGRERECERERDRTCRPGEEGGVAEQRLARLCFRQVERAGEESDLGLDGLVDVQRQERRVLHLI